VTQQNQDRPHVRVLNPTWRTTRTWRPGPDVANRRLGYADVPSAEELCGLVASRFDAQRPRNVEDMWAWDVAVTMHTWHRFDWHRYRDWATHVAHALGLSRADVRHATRERLDALLQDTPLLAPIVEAALHGDNVVMDDGTSGAVRMAAWAMSQKLYRSLLRGNVRRTYKLLATLSENQDEFAPSPVISPENAESLTDFVHFPEDGRGAPVWSEPEWMDTKLVRRVVPARIRRSWRPSTVGFFPRRVDRLPMDGAVFDRPRRRTGGTMLVDSSGSMAWSDEDLDELLAIAPAATVVAYWGGPERQGRMAYLAKDGRAVDASQFHSDVLDGVGNDCDLPALQWLARQPGPRVWVSDQATIPVRGNYEQAVRQCLQTCARAGIWTAENMDVARDLFRRLKKR
jgi:hypothetical protein